MACYRPLKAFFLPNQPVKNPRFNPDQQVSKWSDPEPEYIRAWNYKIFPGDVLAISASDGKTRIKDPDMIMPGDFTEFQYIPCRKCFGCRTDSKKAWTDRLLIESQRHDESWFVTLTYDDEHLPMCFLPDENGIIPDEPTLQKRDLQLFFKNLRSRCGTKSYKELYGERHLMYYASGEYGDSSKRPHYHAIIFGLHVPDLKEWKRRNGFVYYSSDWLSDVWENRGFVSLAKVNRETIAYTCRYVMKKAFDDDAASFIDRGLEPEFHVMSKRPSIARTFFDEKVSGSLENYYVNKIHYLTGPDAEPVSYNIPRYFDMLIEKENSDILVSVKKKRKQLGESRQKLLEAQSSKSYLDILKDQEINKISSNINLRNSKGGI